MAFAKPTPIIVGILLLFAFAPGVAAFGAGNIASISKVEGQNCEIHPPSRRVTFDIPCGSIF